MAKKVKTPKLPDGWETQRKAVRTDVMPTRIHGQRSRRTERRIAKQRGYEE